MDMGREIENDRERAMEMDMDRAMGGEMTTDMQRARAIYVRCDGRIWHAMRRMQYQQTGGGARLDPNNVPSDRWWGTGRLDQCHIRPGL